MSHTTVTDADERMLGMAETCRFMGGVTPMTLWRWERDPDLRFPKRIKLGRNRVYWRLSELRAYVARRAAETDKPAPEVA